MEAFNTTKEGVVQAINHKSDLTEKQEEFLEDTEDYVKPDFKFKELEVKKKIEGDFKKFAKGLYYGSKIIVLVGARGSGKSMLASKMCENISRLTNKDIYYIKGESELPFIELSDITEIPNNAVCLVDEGALSANSRNSMSKNNKTLSEVMAISRHKSLTLLFNVQFDSILDKNVLGMADTIIVKKSSLLSKRLSRRELKDIYVEAEKHLKNKGVEYAYIMDNEFVGLVTAELPSFFGKDIKKHPVRTERKIEDRRNTEEKPYWEEDNYFG